MNISRPKFPRILYLAAAMVFFLGPGLCARAGTLADSFNTNVDYLVNGVAGTIWDGVYFGAGEFANTGTGGGGAGSTIQCDANLSTNSTLTLQTTGTAWEGVDDDGFFLYKVVKGDFSAVVRVVSPYDTAGYNTAGLQARAFSAGGNPLGGSEDYVSWARFDQFSFANYLRNEVNGGVTQINPGDYPNTNYWLRVDRVNGTNFNFYQRAGSNDAWLLVSFPAPVSGTTLRRADLAGVPLQIGILHATFNNQIGVQFTDFSVTAAEFDAFAQPPSSVTGLGLSSTTNSANVSWTPGAGSSGSVVVLWTGANVLKQTPANGFTYTGNATYGLGDLLLGTNYFVVYAGGGTNVVVTNLPAATTFNAAVFACAGAGASIAYQKNPAIASFSTAATSTGTATNSWLVVDPAGSTLTNYTSLGEWNTNGNFDGWATSQIANALVTNGVLFCSASGTDSQVTKLNFAGGPDLDLGFNDYLELRLQLPADYLGDVQIFYGDTFYSGINATRVLRIPSAQIPKDGAFHTYRLDLGPEVYWRATLRDLRIDALDATGAGKTFALEYLRVGDLTGDLYLSRYTSANPAPGQLHELGRPVIDLESKHFRFQWDTNVAVQSGWSASTARGTLRNLEETWQVYVKHLGYRAPSESWTVANRNGKKYKVNVSSWHSGYWAGGDTGNFGRLNITPDGLRVDPPTWVIPHELMHVFQMHQRDNGSTVDGTWWEGHANYGRELWISYYRNLFPNDSGIDANYIHSGHMVIGHGRDYYLSWPFFVYLDENPDGLPDLGAGIVANIWKNTAPGAYSYATIEQLTPVTPLKDIIGYFARRELTFDYQNQVAITNALNTQNPTLWRRFQLAELVRRGDDTNWWRVPMEMAPMQGAYATHELVPQGSGAGRVVTVNFHGLPDAARTADWRAAFIVISDAGVERYAPLWNAGSNSVTLAANENRVYLSVAGTPTLMPYPGQDDIAYPYRSHTSKQRLHYEVQVFGATPKESNNGSTSGLVQHANGLGWRSASAIVDASAYIGSNARVLDSARVRGNARIEDYAVVRGNAVVTNSAVVSGHALVWESAVVKQNAKVRDWAVISGTAVIADNARVLEHAQIQGGLVTNYATAKGCAILWSGGLVGNYGVIEGDFMTARDVTNGIAYGHLPYTGVPDNWVRVAPNRQFADYEFAAANDSMTRDQIGVTDGYLVGSPTWRSSDAGRSGTLGFNGSNQWAVLDKSLADLPEISVTAWVKWAGGASNQPVWHFGSATNKGMFFTPDDGTGHAEFVIRNGGVEQTLTAPAALVTGVWTHVAVTLSNNIATNPTNLTGRLYVNGVLQQQGAITIKPDQLIAGNSNTAAQHNYLARGADNLQPFFNGSLDSVRVFTKALTNSEIAAMQIANVAPTLAAISNRVIGAGVTLTITNAASDADQPWQALAFSLLAAPVGATIGTNTGVFAWRPTVAQTGSTNPVSVKVTDNGTPNLSATQNFLVTVNPLNVPILAAVAVTNGRFNLQVSGDAGLDYSIQTSTNLTDWSTVFTTNSPALPFNWVDPQSGQWPAQFYRVRLTP